MFLSLYSLLHIGITFNDFQATINTSLIAKKMPFQYERILLYSYFLFGGLAPSIAFILFNSKKKYKLLRSAYMLIASGGSISGIILGIILDERAIGSIGFISLSFIWLYTTIKAHSQTIKDTIPEHKQMMYYSYAASLSSVTLSLWLPLFNLFIMNVTLAFNLSVWISWVPNLLVAHYLFKLS